MKKMIETLTLGTSQDRLNHVLSKGDAVAESKRYPCCQRSF